MMNAKGRKANWIGGFSEDRQSRFRHFK